MPSLSSIDPYWIFLVLAMVAVVIFVVVSATLRKVYAPPVAGTVRAVSVYTDRTLFGATADRRVVLRLANGAVYEVNAYRHPSALTLRPGDRVVVRPCERVDLFGPAYVLMGHSLAGCTLVSLAGGR